MCHNFIVFWMSMLGKNLFRILHPYYKLGIAAYKVFDSVLVPYEGKGPLEIEKNFKVFQSSIQMNIECSFSLMVATWGALWCLLFSSMASCEWTATAACRQDCSTGHAAS